MILYIVQSEVWKSESKKF